MPEKKLNRRFSDPIIERIDRTLHDPENGVVAKLERLDRTLRGSLNDGGKTGLIGKMESLDSKQKLQWGILILMAFGIIVSRFF